MCSVVKTLVDIPSVDMRNQASRIPEFCYGKRLILFAIVFLCGIVITGFFDGFLNIATASRSRLLCGITIQNLITFALPAFIFACILTKKPACFLRLTRGFSCKALAGVLIVFALGMPFLNQLVAWNEALRLPASMSVVEVQLKSLEASAKAMSDVLLNVDSFGSMLVGFLLIGCLTGFCEELFFRGALQRMLQGRSVGPQLSIWISAVIFSIMHFQFYGFVPRIILGAFFGYLLLWSDSIWLSATAHALNNGLVVLSSWLSAKGVVSNLDNLGVTMGKFQWIALISFVVVLALLFVGKDWLFKSHNKISCDG